MISDSGVLIGVLRLRDLLMAPRSKTISEIMIQEPLHVKVSMSLRDLKDFLLVRVLAKESAIGLINGIALGILLGGAAVLWKGNLWLGLAVGVSLAANTLVAVSFGGLVPLILRGMHTDPALASGPLLTTVTDMCGFFFVLSFASALLPRLTG